LWASNFFFVKYPLKLTYYKEEFQIFHLKLVRILL
jgi:hypothetical protein